MSQSHEKIVRLTADDKGSGEELELHFGWCGRSRRGEEGFVCGAEMH